MARSRKRKIPTPGAGTSWSSKDRKALRDNIGVQGWSQVQKKVGGRSKAAVYNEMRRTFGGGGITRGTYTLAQAMTETGYSRTQLKRAADALNMRWLRTAKGGSFLITGEQLEDMANWLAKDYWSKKLKLYCCINCGTTEEPHKTFGLCNRCWHQLRRVAQRHDLPWTASGLLEWVTTKALESFETNIIIINLRKGRAPTRDQLEHLCSYTKPSPEPLD